MNVNKRKLAEITGVSERTLTEWQREGMPHAPNARGRSSEYQTAEVLRWMIDRELSRRLTGPDNLNPVYERARKDKEMADKLALENSRSRGEVIPSEEVEAGLADMFTALRAKLMGIPSKCAPLLMGMSAPSADKFRALLSEHVREALEELADGNIH